MRSIAPDAEIDSTQSPENSSKKEEIPNPPKVGGNKLKLLHHLPKRLRVPVQLDRSHQRFHRRGHGVVGHGRSAWVENDAFIELLTKSHRD